MSRILITGGAGFIGRHVIKGLASQGHQVRVLDNLSPQVHGALPAASDLLFLAASDVEFIRGSVGSLSDLRDALDSVDVVIHLAAETGTGQSMYQVARYADVNIGGTANLLEILANDPSHTVKRVVLASSRSVYGEGAYECPHCSPGVRRFPSSRSQEDLAAARWEHRCVDCLCELKSIATSELDPLQPASVYAASKLAQEHLVSIACRALGIEYAILRLQNVYGPGQSLNNPYTGILSIFSTRLRRGQMLPIFEDGNETRDFVHVVDVASALVATSTAKEAANSIINVGSGIRTSVYEVASVLCDVFGTTRSVEVTGQYRIGDIRHNVADVSKLDGLVRGAERVGLAVGLKNFAQWVSEQPLPEDGLERANRELKKRKLLGD